MLAIELIAAKQRGDTLTTEQIAWITESFTRGDLPAEQMAALLMAIYFQKLSDREGRDFLRCMIDSGVRINLDSVTGMKVDKHSTGGVGDKTSLIVAPVVAAAGVPVPMISGRGLAHTGGTLDKLESIPGFRVNLKQTEFVETLQRIGCVFGAQTDELVPADRKLYALRDVTATVAIPPLIAASILSKKIAEGTNALVLDVKIGSGGFLPDEAQAQELAAIIVEWAESEGVLTTAYGTDMNQPLGRSCGNAPEVRECLDILRTGIGESRLIELCKVLGGAMLMLAGKAESQTSAEKLFGSILQSGKGFVKMKEVAVAQGASAETIERFSDYIQPRRREIVTAGRSGYVSEIEPRAVGLALVSMGAGRSKSSDVVDPTAGINFFKVRGDSVDAGEPVAELLWSNKADSSDAFRHITSAIEISESSPQSRKLISFRCDRTGIRTVNSGQNS